jgi:hypothetical protein
MTITLGDRVRDTVSGFVGTAIARTSWLTGCDSITVAPDVDKDGKLPDSQGFDEMRLEVVKPVSRPKPGPALAG